MERIVMMIIRNILHLPIMAIKLFYHAANIDHFTDQQHYKTIKYIVKRANKCGNVTIKAYGVNNIPKRDGFIFYPNHQGLYDVLAMIQSCPNPFSFVLKKEVENVPFLKQVFHCMRAFAIDRNDVRQSMKVIIGVAEEVKKGRNYVIFPEGTRSKKGNLMNEFKGGSFKAATMAKCPIVPVALIDAFKPFDSHTIRPVEVQVHYLEPIYYEEYKDMKTVEIAKEVQDRIQRVIEENSR